MFEIRKKTGKFDSDYVQSSLKFSAILYYNGSTFWAQKILTCTWKPIFTYH